jgi:isochorismate pyruvate lyase
MASAPQEVNLDSRFAAVKEANMTSERVSPAECRTMAEVRKGVDALDASIVALIGERFRYMDAAARIKPVREAVRDEARKAEVLANVAAHAEREGVPSDVAADLYEGLVEASIAYEFVSFDERPR